MNWERHSGVVVSLAVLASVVAHFALHRQFETRYQQLIADAQFSSLNSRDPMGLPLSDRERSQIPRILDPAEPPQRLEHILPALQIRQDGDNDGVGPRRSEPKPVPVPHESTPQADSPRGAAGGSEAPAEIEGDNAVRRVIDEELLGSSREERDIWYEELKSIPAGVVRDLLQVRKQLRSLPRALHATDIPESVPAPAKVRAVEVSAEPTTPSRRQPFPDWAPTVATLEQATSLARHNVANSMTPGFKRIRWHLVDAYNSLGSGLETEDSLSELRRGLGLPVFEVDGCRLSHMLLDMKSGVLKETARPLDLAIDGGGFFVAIQNGKTVYSRCGVMGLDAERRLCLTLGNIPAVLQPVITLPEDAKEIQITAKGEVLVLQTANSDAEQVGHLQLASFAAPERLRPLGATLYAATEESGLASLGEPDSSGRGAIQQGCLEQSNVDVESEYADMERVQSLLKSIPVMARPVTAGKTGTASQ